MVAAGNLSEIYRDPVLDAIDGILEADAAEEAPRDYLGASGLGDPCESAIYYRLHSAPSAPRRASLIRAANDGHTTEARMAVLLRRVPGIELKTADRDGKQFGFSDFAGRFRGHIDGAIRGLPQAPTKPHIWENKAVNEKRFNEFRNVRQKFGEKRAMQEFDFKWFVQAQIYMGYFDYDRHYLTVCSAGLRDYLSCRTEFDGPFFESQRARARRILGYTELPPRIHEDSAYYLCRRCDFRDHCHG